VSVPRTTVRQRLTAAVAAAVALALIGVGVTLYVVESRRIDRSIEAALTQEIGEFRALQSEPDPRTNRPFASADRVMTVFLQRNLPDENESLFAFGPTGGPSYQGDGDARLQSSPIFRDAVDALRGDGGTRTIQVDGHEYRIVVQPLTDDTGDSAFVVTHDVSAAHQDLRELMITYALLGALSVILVAGLASWVVGRLLSPLRSLQRTARAISGGDLTTRSTVTGSDDLSELQIAFNQMLDRVESAFATQRQLLDDAGHELRTPLTVLRGHLEVLDTGDPADITATRSLLLDEIDRMSRLVDDLLMLAKARRPDFVVPEPTDVNLLTIGVMQRAEVLADRRWVMDEVAEGIAEVDPQRLTQAMLQLCDNAVKHTVTGDEIAVGSRLREGRLDLWVRDTGSGVDPALGDDVFERFTRGGTDDNGFGLGLSIVRAIAIAHGGDVTLDGPAHTTGALFRIRIPDRTPEGGHHESDPDRRG